MLMGKNAGGAIYNSEMIRTLIAVFVLRAVSIAATAAVPTIDQSLEMKPVTGARISPDGRFVA
jgi:hypothetical protein